jgi:hypothetical protein
VTVATNADRLQKNSGGPPDIGAFLIAAGSGPEKQELLHLIVTLALEGRTKPSVRVARIAAGTHRPRLT